MNKENGIMKKGEDELYGVIVGLRGANRVTVKCEDGETRIGRIPGRMQKKVWIREDDLVIIEPWEWQDEKGDVVYRYEQSDAEEILDDLELSVENTED